MMKIPAQKKLQNILSEFHIYQKTWNGDLVTFVFQVRESPALLNIPTLTPAPDRLGPVAFVFPSKIGNEQ